MFNLSKSVYHYQRMYGKEAKGTAKTVPQIAAEKFAGDKSLQEDCKRYVLAAGIKPSGNTKELLRQFIAVKNARAKKYAEDNFCGPEHACNFDEPMAKALGQRAGIVQLAADHFDFGNAVNQTTQGAAAGGIFGAALGALNSILSGLSGRRWTGEEKDFAKLYMSITGRTKFDNNATVGANGQAAGGEPIEYTQHIPEAATYFTLKYGKPITDRASALAAIGETWTDGLWNRIYGRDANTWKSVFTRNGLQAPPLYTFGAPGVDYSGVIQQLNNGTFKPQVTPAGAGGLGGILSGVFGGNDSQATQTDSTQPKGNSGLIIAVIVVVILFLIFRK